MTLTVLTPIYNDWTALSSLIAALDRELAFRGRTASILIVDDGSQQAFPDNGSFSVSAVTAIDVLHLRRNVGHQRAIAVGLAWLEANGAPDAVVVMDGDGEDRAEDVNRLVDKLEAQSTPCVVFAERTRRSEGVMFTALYGAYRLVHLLLTGERVRVGNFSVIPRVLLRRLVATSELWNHYAAAVFKARIRFTTIPTTRGTRYAGASQMNFVGLVTHGLSAMSVFGDRIGVRLLIASCALSVVVFGFVAAFLIWQGLTGTPFPDWAIPAGIGAIMLLFLLFATSLAFVFIILSGRGNSGFLPFREFPDFVSHSTSLTVAPLNVEHNLHRN